MTNLPAAVKGEWKGWNKLPKFILEDIYHQTHRVFSLPQSMASAIMQATSCAQKH